MSASATYVYCVVKGGKAAPKKLAKRGLDGTEKPRWLDAGEGYRLLVTTAPLELYDAAVIDARLRDIDWVGARAAEHESIVEKAAESGTVVPMKLFTMFSSDERAIKHVVAMKKSLERVVERIAGCEEWGLRILLDEARAAKARAAEASKEKKAVSGTSFLQRKKALDEERRSANVRGAELVDALYEKVAKIARRGVRRAAPNRELAGKVLLDAVFLVPSGSVKRVKTAVAGVADALVAEGFDISLSGPWPAYSFIGGR